MKQPNVKSKTTTIKENKSNQKWSKVKIAGNLVTDDGGGLEGLIGLEMMEDYDVNSIKKDQFFPKGRNKRYHSDEEDEDNDESNRKSKKTKQKRKNSLPSGNFPGQFVLLHQKNDNESNSEDKQKKADNLEDVSEWKQFGIAESILKALSEKGFKKPTEIQLLTIPPAVTGRKDILGAAETGSGKTLAFGIPILNGILELQRNHGKLSRKVQKHVQSATNSSPQKKAHKRNERDNLTPPPEEINNFPKLSDDERDDNIVERLSSKPLYALVLTPTRELAVQVKDHLVAAAKYTNIKVAAVFGGLAQVKQERVLKRCPEIVVATPGRLWELISEGNEHLNKIEDISFLVIDETDRMVEKGHFEELKLLLERINADPIKKAARQNFVFSATLALVHELPAYLQAKKQKTTKQSSGRKIKNLIDHLGMSKPKIVDITRTTGTAQLLTECRITCKLEQKDLYLYYFLQRHPGRTMVFCNSIDCVKRLGKLFTLLACQPRPLHAQMNQKQRLKNLEKFAASSTGLLIATDVAARGLDIPNVQHVIHYQVPRTSENYIHRSGRTARANKEGITVLLMDPSEAKHYMKLCRTLERDEDLPLFPVSDKHLKSVKSRVDLAREVDVLELKIRRSQNEIGWLKKSAKEMDILIDDKSDFSEDELYDSDDGGDRYKINREMKQKRDHLQALLAKPVFPKGFSYKYPTSTGHLEIPLMEVENNKENAVEVMKTAIEDYKLAKKQRNKRKR